MIEQHVQFAFNQPAQPIEGFGGTFCEKGWEALSTLPADSFNTIVIPAGMIA